MYLIEEKYNKNLLKNNNREFGPIIYFSKKQLRDFNYDFIESFNNAEINAQFPHKKNSRAIELLEGYRRGNLNPEQVFNFEKTSTLFAISELVGYVHHLQFHNIKFYYNAREDRLEPIANDFQFDFLNKWTRETIFLAGLKKNNNYILLPWAENLYKSQKFISLIIKKLKIFTSSDFLDSFFRSINADEEKAKILISGFDPLYIPDVKEKMNKNSQQLNHILNLPPNLEIAISRKEKKIIYKSLSYLPIIALSINKDSNTLYKFEKNKNLRLNNFGEVPLRDTINLKNINLEMLNKELTLKYKITGKTTAQYQQIHITD